jgi:hypothetical protein
VSSAYQYFLSTAAQTRAAVAALQPEVGTGSATGRPAGPAEITLQRLRTLQAQTRKEWTPRALQDLLQMRPKAARRWAALQWERGLLGRRVRRGRPHYYVVWAAGPYPQRQYTST